jgi:stalled ribosome alternative rescue factor ArfA
MFKNHELYKFYEIYIDNKRISNGAKKLMKMSESSFEDFKFQYKYGLDFKIRIDEMVKSEIRDNKIDDILDDDFFR